MHRFGILTLSFNKAMLINQAIASVLSQSFGDFVYLVVDNSTAPKVETMKAISRFKDERLIVIEDEVSMDDRNTKPVAAMLFEKYLEKMLDWCEILLYLADDDILYADCLEEINRYFVENPAERTCYHWLDYVIYRNGGRDLLREFRDERIFGPGVSPDCAIDGGSFSVYTESLRVISRPWVPQLQQHAYHADGLFMEHVCNSFPAKPLKKVLSEKRATRVSCFGSKV